MYYHLGNLDTHSYLDDTDTIPKSHNMSYWRYQERHVAEIVSVPHQQTGLTKEYTCTMSKGHLGCTNITTHFVKQNLCHTLTPYSIHYLSQGVCVVWLCALS